MVVSIVHLYQAVNDNMIRYKQPFVLLAAGRCVVVDFRSARSLYVEFFLVSVEFLRRYLIKVVPVFREFSVQPRNFH